MPFKLAEVEVTLSDDPVFAVRVTEDELELAGLTDEQVLAEPPFKPWQFQ